MLRIRLKLRGPSWTAATLLALGSVISSEAAIEAKESEATSPAAVGAQGWRYVDLRRWPAAEARQGVAVDADFFYVIANHAVGKYRQDTGERVARWECPKGEPLVHLNAGVVRDGRLYCAHSNYPGVPMQSSVEIFDTATLRHVGSRSFGRSDGSLTWLDWRDGRWIACFVHYGRKGGEPGRGPEWTRLVEFDEQWREQGGWVFPDALMARLGERGFSVSGGAFGPGGFLYVTGHDHRELYLLELPSGGAVLKWIATVPIAAQGQAFGWDPQEPDLLYSLSRDGREVLVGRIEPPREIAARKSADEPTKELP